jgi:hypothetical protein
MCCIAKTPNFLSATEFSQTLYIVLQRIGTHS